MTESRKSTNLDPKLLIMRGLSIIALIWIASYIYISSDKGSSDFDLIHYSQKETLYAKELQEKLDVLKDIGTKSDLIDTRSKWMLLLLSKDLPEESFKNALKQAKDIRSATEFSIDQKIPLYEEVALVYRGSKHFQQLQPLYSLVEKEVNQSDLDEQHKTYLLSRVKNNLAVSLFFEGLSEEAPSLKAFEKRIQKFELAKKTFDSSLKPTEKFSASDTNKKDLQFHRSVIEKNIQEVTDEIIFARLRERSYEEAFQPGR